MAITALPFSNINFEVFHDSNRLVGVAEVSLPDIEMMNVDTSGAGIAGKFSAPVMGFVDSLEMELTWRTIVSDLSIFATPHAVDLILYSAMENYNASNGQVSPQQVKIALRGFNKKMSLGSLKPAEQTETKTTLEIIQLEIKVAGAEILYFDKVNYTFRSGGTDYLAGVRTALNI